MAWQDSTTPFFVEAGQNHHRPMTVVVDPSGGSAQIQLRASTGVWFTPEHPDYTMTQAGPYRIERSNTPEMRIIATGTARFEVTLSR